MGRYLIDNNLISHYFSELFPESAMSFISDVIDSIPNISIITEIEILSWVNPNKSKEEIIREFVNASNILAITPAIVERCVAIRRSKKLKTPDSIIAATAIVHDFTLLTSDNGFTGIAGLKIIDPYRL